MVSTEVCIGATFNFVDTIARKVSQYYWIRVVLVDVDGITFLESFGLAN